MESQNINVSFEYICLKCNQLFTSKDLFKHLQYFKDHIDTCIHIDDIKRQLSNIGHINYPNISYKSNNIFKKRIETIWSELNSLSRSYTNLSEFSKDISYHFENLHNQLIIREHSLKKQIKDDINLISCDIIHQINELKLILNIINQNNKNKNKNNNYNNGNNNDNNNSSEDSDIESSDSENQDKYKITSIINSINRSKFFNRFISENKNTLFYNNINRDEGDNIEFITILNNIINFNKEFNSSLSNPTNLYSQSSKLKVNSKYIVRIDRDHNDKFKKLIEESIRVDVSPSFLVRIGDFQQLQDYFNRNKIRVFDAKQVDIVQTIIETLKSNRIDIFKYLFNELHFSIKAKFSGISGETPGFRQFEYSLLDFAIINSNSETIKYIEAIGINNNIKWDYSKALELSPLTNSISMLQYFTSKDLGIAKPTDIYVSANAILKGHIEMVQWISQNTPFTFIYGHLNAINLAASCGHLEIIKWLHKNRTEGCTTKAMDEAAKNGYLDIVKWLHENRTEGCSISAMNDAASHGHFDIIKWLHENRTEGCTTSAMNHAARNGHFEIIKWLHHNRTEGCSDDAMDEAAEYGHFEIVKWLHYNRTEGGTILTMDFAARHGHLRMAKWLHENRTEGCSTGAMNNAAEYGHLKTIKWLHFNRTEGCTTDAMDNAAMNGHLEIIKWLHENRTEGCTFEAKDLARRNKRLEVVKWFDENENEIRISEIQEY